MDKLKIGIIGTGNISSYHMDSYLKNPDVELYSLCDINEKQLSCIAKKYDIRHTFTDINEMLRQEELDAVSICTWNSAHAPCSIAALNAGKHVLCEKPMATSAKEASEMMEAARRSGKTLMIGFVRRFGNDCAILKDFIDADYLGEMYYAKVTYLRRNGSPGGWFGDKSLSAGGPMIDLGVHVIDLARYLMGNPKPVSVYGAAFQKLFDRPHIKGGAGYASVSKSNTDIYDVEDLASALIRFDNGAVISVETSFSLNIEKDIGSVELFGTKAGARLDPDLKIYSDLNNYLVNISLDTNTALNMEGLFENEINHFVSCIKEKIPCRAPAEDGVEIMRILDAIYDSARTGHEIILD